MPYSFEYPVSTLSPYPIETHFVQDVRPQSRSADDDSRLVAYKKDTEQSFLLLYHRITTVAYILTVVCCR